MSDGSGHSGLTEREALSVRRPESAKAVKQNESGEQRISRKGR